jgi:hypothetical protein
VVAADFDDDESDFDDDESDLSLEALDELLDFSEELDVSLELEPSELDDELDLAEPLLEFFVDSRLSLR